MPQFPRDGTATPASGVRGTATPQNATSGDAEPAAGGVGTATPAPDRKRRRPEPVSADAKPAVGSRKPPPGAAAAAPERQEGTPLCRDYARPGGCVRSSCRYRHELPESAPQCIDFALGKCMRVHCRFRHVPSKNQRAGDRVGSFGAGHGGGRTWGRPTQALPPPGPFAQEELTAREEAARAGLAAGCSAELGKLWSACHDGLKVPESTCLGCGGALRTAGDVRAHRSRHAADVLRNATARWLVECREAMQQDADGELRGAAELLAQERKSRPSLPKEKRQHAQSDVAEPRAAAAPAEAAAETGRVTPPAEGPGGAPSPPHGPVSADAGAAAAVAATLVVGTVVSRGRGGDDLTVDGDVESNPGPAQAGYAGPPGCADCSPTPARPFSRGRGGDDLAVDGCVERNPGPEDPLGSLSEADLNDFQELSESTALALDSSGECILGDAQAPVGSDSQVGQVVVPPAAQAAPATPAQGAKKCVCGKVIGKQGRHRKGCPRNGLANDTPQFSQNKRQRAGPFQAAGQGPMPPPALPAPPLSQGQSPPQGPSQEVPDGPDGYLRPLPTDLTFASVTALRVPTLTRIPSCAAVTVGSALEIACRRATGDEGWLRLMAFPSLVLRRCRRGGAKAIASELRRRVGLWRSGDLETLWAEAQAALVEGSKVAPKRYPLEGEEDRWHWGLGTEVAGVDDLDDATVRRVVRLARQRDYRRAVSALSAVKVAPATEEVLGKLRERHPSAPVPGIPPKASEGVPLSRKQLKKALKGFPRGTAAGPSGLTAQHLLDLWCASSPLPEGLRLVVNRIIQGAVPEVASRYVFGALLVPLEKKDGGIRPIAVGEVLRRLAAKGISAQLKEHVSKLLLKGRQFGVGIPSGADTIAHTFRRVAESYRQALSGLEAKGFAKMDFANAFNRVDRGAILRAVAKHAPDALPYAVAAYGNHTNLSFGVDCLTSECGVQQGDPLGPLFFSLVLLDVLQQLEADHPGLTDGLDAAGFYLDDGTVAGEWPAVAKWLDAFEPIAASVGLHLNKAKSELIVFGDRDAADATFDGFKRFSADCWELLGLPCGTPESVAAAAAKAFERSARRTAAIASLPDPHAALALLRSCAGFATIQFLMRGVGAAADFEQVDRSTRAAVGRITGIDMSDKAWEQAVLPIRSSGLGIHDCAEYAALACLAASADAARLADRVTSIQLPSDPFCTMALGCPRLAHYPDVLKTIEDSRRADGIPEARSQKRWSKSVDIVRAGVLFDSASTQDKARLQSCSAKHASGWLYGHPESGEDLWLKPQLFVAALRLRLGLPILETPSTCRLCNSSEADVFGHHSLACISGGLRTRAHNAIRDGVDALARSALLTPAREPRPFANSPQSRLDISVSRDGVLFLYDIALTFPLQQSSVQAAALEQGGAATKYEAIKRNKYLPLIAQEPRPADFKLVPLICDTFGAWGDSAAPALATIAHAWGLRSDLRPAIAMPLAMHRLNFVIIREVARIALANGPIACG